MRTEMSSHMPTATMGESTAGVEDEAETPSSAEAFTWCAKQTHKEREKRKREREQVGVSTQGACRCKAPWDSCQRIRDSPRGSPHPGRRPHSQGSGSWRREAGGSAGSSKKTRMWSGDFTSPRSGTPPRCEGSEAAGRQPPPPVQEHRHGAHQGWANKTRQERAGAE